MKTNSVTIHNFRSIKEVSFEPSKYTVLVGANNAGKSNVLTALRIFYEDDIKFNEKTDFPKLPTDDNESWIEVEYLLTDNEFASLKDDYRRPNNTLKVRKYLKSDQRDRVKSNQSNIYGYVNDTLSDSLFYGAKNISEAKLGSIIYIPEVATTDDALKLSGPSPLRNVITFVMNKVVKGSESFTSLSAAFEEFNDKFKEEASKDGFSLSKLREEINLSLREWEVEFDLRVNAIKPEEIIKNLISHYTIDKSLEREMDVRLLGQGLQRHLIYTLLNVSAKYAERKITEKKDFSPELTLLLFEEPEAFLHPSQQESLNSSLRLLSQTDGQQVFVTVHSPIFVSNNIEEISSLVRLRRENGVTRTYQVSEDKKGQIIAGNNELAQLLKSKAADNSVSEPTKRRIKEILGNTDNDTLMEEEAIRYLLWLDSERCSAFFADLVLICEGATEKTFICYLIRNKWEELKSERICVLDAMGKFNIHRYMNLFKELGIYHSILADKDEGDIHDIVNPFIQGKKNEYTRAIDFFSPNIETFLGIQPPASSRADKKPLNVLWNYYKGNINQDKIDALKAKVSTLLR